MHLLVESRTEEKSMQEENNSIPTRLMLVKILSTQRQVVAGINFCLKLKVRVNGKSKVAEAIVWWQAWSKPEPYRLTSWKWKDERQ